jgi:hypothetical protein
MTPTQREIDTWKREWLDRPRQTARRGFDWSWFLILGTAAALGGASAHILIIAGVIRR